MATQKSKSERQYDFSDGVLEQLGDKTHANIIRDLTTLAARGVTATTAANLLTLVNDFKGTTTDEEARAAINDAVLTKDDERNNLNSLVSRLRTAVANKFTESSPRYTRYKFKNVKDERENDLVRLLKSMQRIALAQQTALASEGIDATFLADFLAAIIVFDDALDAVDKAKEDRDNLTEQRIDTANVLYKEVARLCNIGKDVFAPISESRYNDYVIERFVSSKNGVIVLATFEDILAALAIINLGLLPTGSLKLRINVLAGGPLEIGLSVDGLTFSGNTVTLAGVGVETITIEDLASLGSLILVKNQSATVQGQYKIEVLG